MRSELEKLRSELGLEDCVQMPGFKQYEELPSYYAHAGAFIHASTTEQWGLVVNEAMASGLPVLVSNRCGCARDLVRDGENGWTFDPTNEEQLADLMLRISSDEERRKEMGHKSREIIAEWGPDRFASGVKAAVEAALAAPRKTAGLLDRFILKVLTSKGQVFAQRRGGVL
jgi:glycosyltransferase involved in cell wall biosynthesis